MMELDLSAVDYPFIEEAKSAWTENDILRILCYMSNERCLGFVLDNRPLLRERGLYEKALVYSYVGTRTNYSRWSPDLIKFLFSMADRRRLIEAGDPLPGNGPFTVYRGVSGRGAARRVRGISWTGSFERAVWFAKRFSDLEKPAVFRAVVDKSLIFGYSNDRQESEFLCDIPLDLKLKKVWPQENLKRKEGTGPEEVNIKINEGGGR
jgi:hypothetical protein